MIYIIEFGMVHSLMVIRVPNFEIVFRLVVLGSSDVEHVFRVTVFGIVDLTRCSGEMICAYLILEWCHGLSLRTLSMC